MRQCKDGSHSLVEIDRTDSRLGLSEKITRWCEYCGAIVIDKEIDGKVIPGFYIEMQFPLIAKES